MDKQKRVKNNLEENLFGYFLNFFLRLVAQSTIIVIIFYRLIHQNIDIDYNFYLLLSLLIIITFFDKISYLNIPGLIEIKKLSEGIQETYKKVITKVDQTQAQQQITNNYLSTSQPDYPAESFTESVPDDIKTKDTKTDQIEEFNLPEKK